MPDLPSARQLDAGLSFNMLPGGGVQVAGGGVQVPTGPPQPAPQLSVPIQDQTERPTQPQIPLHAEHPENDKAKLELRPNRDQVYHVRGRSTYNSLFLLLLLLFFNVLSLPLLSAISR